MSDSPELGTTVPEVGTRQSAQSCGCDPGLKKHGVVVGHLCERHRREQDEMLEEACRMNGWV